MRHWLWRNVLYVAVAVGLNDYNYGLATKDFYHATFFISNSIAYILSKYHQTLCFLLALSGLWFFISMLEITLAYSQEELDRFKAATQQFLGRVV